MNKIRINGYSDGRVSRPQWVAGQLRTSCAGRGGGGDRTGKDGEFPR